MKIRHEIILTGLLLYIAFSLLFYLYYENVKNIVVQRVEEDISITVNVLSNYFQNLLDQAVSNLLYLSDLKAFKESNYEEISKILKSFRENVKIFHGFSFIDSSGIMRVLVTEPERPDLIGKNFSFREYFREAIKGKIYISEPFLAKTGNYIFVVSVPVYDYHGNIVGVLSGSILVENNELKNIIENVKSFYIAILCNGKVLMDNGVDVYGKNIIERKKELYRKLNVSLLVRYNPYTIGNLNSIIKQYLIFSLIYFIVFIVAYLYINRDIIKPIVRLSSYIKELSEGRYGIELFESCKCEEIKTLVENFNLLSKRLKEYILEIVNVYKRLKNIVENIDIALVVVDKDGNILLKNKLFKKILGDISHVSEYTKEIISKRKKMLEKNIRREIVKIKNRFYMYSISPVSENLLLESFVDVTREVKEKKRLMELESIKRKIIYNISHEIKTPLTIILLSASILKDTLKDNKEIVLKIVRNAKRIKDIIEKLLNYYIVERTEYPHFEKINVKNLVESILEEYQDRISEKELVVKLDIPENCTIFGCNILLKVALRELIDNAIKFNKKGGLIEIRAKEYEKYVRISIRDTGIGLTEEDKEKILQPYVQTKEFYKGKPSGLGLGLAIVKRVLELHGSKLYVKSEPNKGTEFYFYLEKS